jgi:hypothetical protein
VSAPPVDPAQPVVVETSGKATPVTAVSASDALAPSVNDPEPDGRKNCVLVVEP